MRLLYLVHQFFPEFASGTERVTLQLAQAQQRHGHHVQVLGCRVQPEPGTGTGPAGAHHRMVEGVSTWMLPHARLPGNADTALDVDETLAAELERWMREQAFDVVHLMHGMRMGSAISAAQRAGLPMVVTATDFHLACLRINLVDLAGRDCAGPEQGRACAARCLGPSWSEQALQRRHAQAQSILAYASARVVPSAFVATRCEAAFPGLGFTVLPHGIDLLALAAAARTAPPPAPPQGMHLGFVGSLIAPKGLDLLLQALALRPQLPVTLSVAGSFHDDAAYEARIRNLAAADARVRLVGRLDRGGVAALLRTLDLLCLPSRVPETYSLIVHEAAAFGVPALVSPRGAPATALQASGAGAVVADDSPASWAAALDRWAADAELRTAWRQRVALPPRIEEEAFLYESLYLAALAAPPAG